MNLESKYIENVTACKIEESCIDLESKHTVKVVELNVFDIFYVNSKFEIGKRKPESKENIIVKVKAYKSRGENEIQSVANFKKEKVLSFIKV